jgi:hypothetical protein
MTLGILQKACEPASCPLPKLAWALDGDEAGRAFAQKHLVCCQKRPREATIASIPCTRGKKKRDWNNLHLSHGLDEKHTAEWRY